MLDVKPDFMDLAHRLQHHRALTRSQSKGGAAAHNEREKLAPGGGVGSDGPPLADAELVQLHIRVIALENMVIAMLAKGSDRQLDFAREMADYISPRPGFTLHHRTIGAAEKMNSLVERAGRFRRGPPARARRCFPGLGSAFSTSFTIINNIPDPIRDASLQPSSLRLPSAANFSASISAAG